MKVQFFIGTLLMCLGLGLGFDCNAEVSHASDAFSELKKRVMQRPEAPLLDRELFNWEAPIGHVMLAPNGKHLAYSLKQKQHVEIWRYDLATQSHHRLISVKQIKEMAWSANSQHVYYLDAAALFYVDMYKGNQAEKILALDDIHLEFIRPDAEQATVFWLSRYLPHKRQHSLIRAEVNGAEHIALTSDTPIGGFLSHHGEIKVVKYRADNQSLIANLTNGKIGDTLLACGQLAPCHLHHWNDKSQRLLVSAHLGQDVLSLFSLDGKSGEKRLIHQDPTKRFDVNKVNLTLEGAPQLISYRTDYQQHYGLTAPTQQVLQRIRRKIASPMTFLSLSDDQQVWLVVNGDPTIPIPEYYVYLPSADQWQSPFAHITSQAMDSKWVAPRVPFWYTASDGMRLQGYLTLPLGKDPKNVPLVVNPHGGPWNRSHGAFNRYVQFLANRGYAVFEPNFRSSTGLGRNYLLSAQKDFGNGRVQQDMVDGLDYLLASGIGDANKLAVAGHSFGGFSALTALAFTPDKFAVAFAGAAPSNLSHAIMKYAKSQPPLKAKRNMPKFKQLMVDISDPDDVKRLYQQSPDKHWQNIKRPVYMWAGGRDDRVAIEDVRDLALRLEIAKEKVVLLSDPNEGHNPDKDIAREAYFYLLEQALARHLKGRMDNKVSSTLSRYLNRYLIIDTVGVTTG